MNEKEFQRMVELLGLPGGATVVDCFAQIESNLLALRSVADDEEGRDAKAQIAAATARLCHLTGEPTLSQAVSAFEASLVRLDKLEKDFAAERDNRKALELGEYRALTAELVQIGAETPYLAWADEKRTQPAKHLLAMTLPELRSRVKHFKAAHKGHQVMPVNRNLDLSEEEIAMCEAKGVDPKVYASTKAKMMARSGRAEAV